MGYLVFVSDSYIRLPPAPYRDTFGGVGRGELVVPLPLELHVTFRQPGDEIQWDASAHVQVVLFFLLGGTWMMRECTMGQNQVILRHQ